MSTPLPAAEFAELPRQPADSIVQVQETPDGLTLTIPWKAGLRPFGLLSVIVSVWLGLVAYGVSTRLAEQEELHWIEIGFFSLFALVGLGFLVGGAYGFLQERTFTISRDALSIRQTTLFGSEQHQWQREQLADVFVQHYPGDSDHADTWELQIHPLLGQGDELHLSKGMKPDDLRWLATFLRQRLHCPGNAPCSPPPGSIVISFANNGMPTAAPFQERSEQPAASKVRVEQSVDGLQLTLPPDRLRLGELRSLIYSFVFVICLGAVASGFFFWGGWREDLSRAHEVWAQAVTAAGVTFCAFPATLLLIVLVVLARLRRQQADIRVQDGNLSVTHRGMVRRRSYHWSRAQGPDVRLGHPQNPFGLLWELQIHADDEKPVGLLLGRDPCELQWLATVIRRALREHASSPARLR